MRVRAIPRLKPDYEPSEIPKLAGAPSINCFAHAIASLSFSHEKTRHATNCPSLPTV